MATGSIASRWQWAIYGALFGCAFPVMAGAIRAVQLGGDAALGAFAEDPLLWIILTAPVFLGSFAYLGGSQHDEVRELSRDLERRVELRTAELAEALEHVKLILDNTGDALISIDLHGHIIGEPSASARTWFGPPLARTGTWLFGNDERTIDAFEIGLEQIRDDILPFELLVDQLPVRTRRDERAVELLYRRIEREGTLVALLVIARDVTARERAEAVAAQQREQHDVLAHALGDPPGFAAFVAEQRTLVDRLAGDMETIERARVLHTIKGSTAVMGAHSVAHVVHGLEDRLAAGDEWEDSMHLELDTSWRVVESFVAELGDAVSSDRVDVRRGDVMALCAEIRDQASTERLLARVQSWEQTPLTSLLQHLASHAARLAQRSQRRVDTIIAAEGIRVDPQRTGAIWRNLVHVIRNAVDHGIETTTDRLAAGKPEHGTVTIEAQRRPAGLVVRISDDGRGVDWDKIRDRCRHRNLPHATDHDLALALFADGMSSRDHASETSGRGVGLAAVKAACDAIGATIAVTSSAPTGTQFVITVPERRQTDLAAA